MQDIRTTIIQTDLHWQNASANISMLEEKIWEIGEPTDLIILPEMFSTGFSMESQKLAEPMNLTTFKWLKQMAEQTKAVITGSFIVKEDGKYYNRLVWMRPDGEYHTYDKRHLFRLAHEEEFYSPGTEKLIVEWQGWKICPLICYDLRFPVWCRNRRLSIEDEMDYDLLIFVANWPQARTEAWDTLLKARSIENQCYTIGVNIVGTDGNDVAYAGHSAIYDYKGKPVLSLGKGKKSESTLLKKRELLDFRSRFPVFLDADPFTVG